MQCMLSDLKVFSSQSLLESGRSCQTCWCSGRLAQSRISCDTGFVRLRPTLAARAQGSGILWMTAQSMPCFVHCAVLLQPEADLYNPRPASLMGKISVLISFKVNSLSDLAGPWNLGASPRSGRHLSPDARVPSQLWGAGAGLRVCKTFGF